MAMIDAAQRARVQPGISRGSIISDQIGPSPSITSGLRKIR